MSAINFVRLRVFHHNSGKFADCGDPMSAIFRSPICKSRRKSAAGSLRCVWMSPIIRRERHVWGGLRLATGMEWRLRDAL